MLYLGCTPGSWRLWKLTSFSFLKTSITTLFLLFELPLPPSIFPFRNRHLNHHMPRTFLRFLCWAFNFLSPSSNLPTPNPISIWLVKGCDEPGKETNNLFLLQMVVFECDELEAHSVEKTLIPLSQINCFGYYYLFALITFLKYWMCFCENDYEMLDQSFNPTWVCSIVILMELRNNQSLFFLENS